MTIKQMKVVKEEDKYIICASEFKEDLSGKTIFSPGEKNSDTTSYIIKPITRHKEDRYFCRIMRSGDKQPDEYDCNIRVFSETVDKYDYFLCDTEEDLALLMLKYGWHDGG